MTSYFLKRFERQMSMARSQRGSKSAASVGTAAADRASYVRSNSHVRRNFFQRKSYLILEILAGVPHEEDH